jgi:two-component system, NarL family, response regulator LiaR
VVFSRRPAGIHSPPEKENMSANPHFPRRRPAPPGECFALECTPRKSVRVVIIDDHELVRHGLAAMIDAEADLECCGAFPAAAPGLVSAVVQLRPDLALVDVSRSAGAGLQLVRAIRAALPDIRIVALVTYQKAGDVDRLFDAGAGAWVPKLELASRVLQAIRRAQAAPVRVDADGRGAAPEQSRGAAAQLDAADRELVALIGQGVPARAIAVRLGWSLRTVEARRRRLRGKLGVATSAELVEFCVRLVQESR